MMGPVIAQEIKFESSFGAALLAASSIRGGEAVLRGAHRMARIFLLRTEWSPGFYVVGGEVDLGQTSPNAPRSLHSIAGCGETLEDAAIACICEGMERLSQVERQGDVINLSFGDSRSQLTPASEGYIGTLLQASTDAEKAQLAWISGTCAASGSKVLAPADWCLRRQRPGSLAIPGAALSTGCAAGASKEEAAVRALLELVERDAASLWWQGGKRAKPVAAHTAIAAEATNVLHRLRQLADHRQSWVLDITSDLQIPCFAAVSVAKNGLGLVCGLAARISATDAVRAAILEMCQMEVGLLLVEAKRKERGDNALNEADKRHLLRAIRVDAEKCALIHPLGTPREHQNPSSSGQNDLSTLNSVFSRAGIDAVIVDLSRPELGLPVVHAIAPQLQIMPGDVRTERLRHVIENAEGRDAETRGIPLF